MTEHTVLIVEDHEPVADLYSRWLSDAYEVKLALDGDTALETIDETIDVALLDRRLPDISGDDVLERIRDRSLDCRAIMVTAVIPDFDIIELGFDRYLTKPVKRTELVDAIERVLSYDEYDDTLVEYHQHLATKAALQSSKETHELYANESFQALEERIRELEEQIDELTADFDQRDFEAAFASVGDNTA